MYKKFIKDAGWMSFVEIIFKLQTLILLPIIAKLFGPSGYGLWAQAMATVSLILPFATLNMGHALARFTSGKDKEIVREGFYSILFFTFVTSIVSVGIFIIFSKDIAIMFFGGYENTNIVLITSMIIFFNVFLFDFMGYYRVLKRFKILSFITISISLGQILLIIILLSLGYDIVGVIFSNVAMYIIIDLILIYFILNDIGIVKPNFHIIAKYLKFALPLLPAGLFFWITNVSDRYVIAYYLGIEQVGIYSVAYGLGSLTLFYVSPISSILLPYLSAEFDKNNFNQVKNYLTYSLKYYLIFAIPTAVGISILSSSILLRLTTPVFVQSGKLLIPVITLAIIFYGIYIIFAPVFDLLQKTMAFGIIWGMAAVLNLVLNIIFVPKIGVIAAAVTTLIAYLLATSITVFLSYRYLPFNYNLPVIGKSIIASSIMGIIIYLMNPVSSFGIILSIFIGIIIYFILMVLLKSFEAKEIKLFMEMLKHKS